MQLLRRSPLPLAAFGFAAFFLLEAVHGRAQTADPSGPGRSSAPQDDKAAPGQTAVPQDEAAPAQTAPQDDKTGKDRSLIPMKDSKQLGVVDGDPSTPGAVDERAARVNEALQARDYEKAETLLLEAAEANPRSPGVLRLLGAVFFMRGKPLNAAVALKKAEAIAPLDERSRFTLVMSYVALGHRDWARPELAKLVDASPGNALYQYWTGRLDYDDQQFAKAVESLRRAVQLDPTLAKAHDTLGLCYEALGRFDEAELSWREAIRLESGKPTRSPWPSLNLGVMLARLDRADAAEARFREAIASDPRFGPAHYQLGLALEKKGRTADALAALEEAARLDPASAEAQYALARVYRRAGDSAKADGALRRFEELKKEKDEKTGRTATSAPETNQ
jgi:Flp pilus assembly protein TadD